ncbi:MAG TPA: TIGR01777 family oxidoreductase [Labilithrix sp.]|nr:TIGR01777 family oxidoreductase [Labilithrix sp.]
MSAFVTGATGTIGRRLLARLGDDVVLTSRNPEKARASIPRGRLVAWDGTAPLDDAALEGVDTVFHLAGEPVAEGRWTDEKKKRIEQSRVQGTRALVDAMERAKTRPRVFVCASAVGIYGSRGDEILTEESAPGTSFLAAVCAAWEREAVRAEELGIRVVRVRTGIVLAREGGALAEMAPLFRTGLAGKLGDGRQWMPWIHLDDIVALFAFAAKDERVRGALNGSAPEPVTNETFTHAMGKALHRPTFMTAPAFAMRLALGEKAEIVLASQRAVPAAALALDFPFAHTSLDLALTDLLAR